MEFTEIFETRASGFDIIIGNPPYIRGKNIDKMFEKVKHKDILTRIYGTQNTTKQMDYSLYFVMRSYELLIEGGFHAYIITNTWLLALFGVKLCHFLKTKTRLLKLLNFGGHVKVFRGASVHPCLFVLQKALPLENVVFCNGTSSLNDLEVHGYGVIQNSLRDNYWDISDETGTKIGTELDKDGLFIKAPNFKVNFGIKKQEQMMFLYLIMKMIKMLLSNQMQQ